MISHSESGNAPRRVFLLTVLATFAVCFWGMSSVRADSLVTIPAGDSRALIEAIEAANQSADVTTIQLNGDSEYRFDLTTEAPPLITGHIVLIGDGARIVGEGPGSFGTLFDISEAGSLELLDLIIADFSTPNILQNLGLIENVGELRIRDLRIEHFALGPNFHAALISNAGMLDVDRLRINDIKAKATAFAVNNVKNAIIKNMLVTNFELGANANEHAFIAYIGNGGCAASLDLSFSSLLNLDAPSPEVWAVIQSNPRPIQCQGVKISASMVVGLGCPFGDQTAISGGRNFVSAENCTSNKASDTIGVFPNAAKLRTEPDGGVAVTLPYFSPARDRISSSGNKCPSRDAIRIPRPLKSTDYGRDACDIGAFEVPPGTPVFEGGENGLYYSSGQDGHYVTIEEVRPDEYVIFWNTFDLNGNHVWVYAQGVRNGGSIEARGYYQSEGVLIPGSGADVNTNALLDWGRLWITLDDCFEGSFRYVSELPQFGSGNFRLDRLALVDALGCSDRD